MWKARSILNGRDTPCLFLYVTLSKVIERVYVYGADRIEIIWKTDDIFYSQEMPEKRKVINPAEMPLVNETPAEA